MHIMTNEPQPTHRSALRTLVARLREQRLARNWSQAEMAARVGISLRAYQDVEGGYGNVTLLNLVRILGALGLTDRLATLIPEPAQRKSLADVTKPPRQRAYRPRQPKGRS